LGKVEERERSNWGKGEREKRREGVEARAKHLSCRREVQPKNFVWYLKARICLVGQL